MRPVEAGVHAIKLQTYTPDTITLDIKDGDFLISDETSLWKGKTLYDLYREAYTPWDWHIPIFERCKQLGMIAFSTPFDETAVDFLEGLDVPCYKIGSPEIIRYSTDPKSWSYRKTFDFIDRRRYKK